MNMVLMGKVLMGFIAFLGIYFTVFSIFWNLFKDARSKLAIHYKFYKNDALHATTKQIFSFIEKRVINFPKEAGRGARVDEKIMPYIVEDFKRYKRIALILNIMTFGVFRYLS